MKFNNISGILFLKVMLTVTFSAYVVQGIAGRNRSLFFKHFDENDGLSQNKTLCLAKNKDGFIWIGTYNGLNRFNGNNFKIFRHVEHDNTSLGNNYITRLFTDNNGILWVGTFNGHYRYYPETETIKHYKINLEDSTKKNLILSIIQTKDDKIWCSTWGNGLLSVNTDSMTTTRYDLSIPDGLTSNSNENGKDYILLHVKDTGIGIPTDKLEIIFDRFRKITLNEDKHYSGVGLGLTISIRIIEMLDGRIWVESEVGKYTKFMFTIPLNNEQ